ncbi:Hypothetical protein OINT_1002068 [Brucella intermedia LMG 3301]|uniref:Uncharacterized protein n=1 Tax=Brucella intermedia LMG 3301 TaxID=641118 RepID=C4WHV1_9HYPH|nr:Hypothetical protein OINT_1002068 [Brucella intermedia LMG 3301]
MESEGAKLVFRAFFMAMRHNPCRKAVFLPYFAPKG